MITAKCDRQIGRDFVQKTFTISPCLLILTDADAVYLDYGTETQRPLEKTTPAELDKYAFDAGSMGPKIDASCEFIRKGGKLVGIGSLEDGLRILQGTAGTNIIPNKVDNYSPEVAPSREAVTV